MLKLGLNIIVWSIITFWILAGVVFFLPLLTADQSSLMELPAGWSR